MVELGCSHVASVCEQGAVKVGWREAMPAAMAELGCSRSHPYAGRVWWPGAQGTRRCG